MCFLVKFQNSKEPHLQTNVYDGQISVFWIFGLKDLKYLKSSNKKGQTICGILL